MNHFLAAPRFALGTVFAVGLLSATALQSALAQTPQPEQAKPPVEASKPTMPHSAEDWRKWEDSSVDRSYKLKYAQSPQDANELLTAMRNMLVPATKIFLVPSSGVIVVHAPEEEQARIVKLLAELDLPRPRYRLTYTLTELDGDRKLGVQHFSMVVQSGQRCKMKQGSRLPVSVGGSSVNFTYLDVGMNFDATLQAIQGGGVLKETVEQTSVAPDSISPNNPNPVLRQTQLEGTTSLVLGKPQRIGSLDVPSSTHHFDVEVVMEPVN